MKTIEEQLDEALAQCKAHEASITELTANATKLACDLQIASADLFRAREQRDSAAAEIETLKATNADLQAKITTTEAKAAEIVAKLGIPAAEVPAQADVVTVDPAKQKADALEKFNACTDPKHRAEIWARDVKPLLYPDKK